MQHTTFRHADLENSQARLRLGSARDLLPGLALAALLALLSYLSTDWIDDLSGGTLVISPIAVAIILGIAIRNGIGLQAVFQPGLTFSQCRILQIGIVLLGLRLSLGEFAHIGISTIPLIVICIGSALVFISLLGRRLGLSPQLATLIAAGTSICGATAIVTTAPIIGARNHEVSYAVACIALFGIIATLVYPPLAHWLFDGDARHVGLFFGTAVHDTSQVIGAGMIWQNQYGNEQALDTATVTKLVRNLSMLIVIPALSIHFQRQHHTGGPAPHWTRLVPLFILGFALASLVRTIGDASDTPFGLLNVDQWQHVVSIAKRGAEFCLLISMAAVGLNTQLAVFTKIGLKPLGLGFAATAVVGLISATLIRGFY